MAKNYNLTYYPWITQHKDPPVIRQNIEVFAKCVADELSGIRGEEIFVTVLEPLEVPAQIESIVSGASQIGLMNPLGFAFARNKNKQINASTVALRIIDGAVGVSYFAQIYTNVNTGIKTLADLRKTSMGYGTSISTSNFVIPALDLKNNKIHPFVAFKRTEFLGGHEIVAAAVYDGKIQAGAGHDGVIVDLAKQPGYEDAKDKLVRIHRSTPIPSDPVAVNVADSEEYDDIQKALVAVSIKSPAKEAIASFWGEAQGLQATDFKPYDYLLSAIQELGLSESDLY